MPKKVSTDILKYNNEKLLSNIGEGVVDFTSGDSTSATSFTSVDTLASKSTLSSLFNKVSTMIKNIRYLYSKVTQLNSDITKSYGLIYLKDGTSTDYWGYVFKLTRNVGYFTMNVPGHKAISANSTVVVATLPAGYYPEREITITVSAASTNINLCGYVRMNGEIVVSNPSSTTITSWRAFGVYYLP